MPVITTFLLTIAILLTATSNATAKSIYEQKQDVCAAIMQKVDQNLYKITDRDRIKDNKHMLKATLWGISYQQHDCDPEPYLNTLRNNL